VYVLPLGGGEAEEAAAHLEKHKRFLRGLLAKKVSMKFMPELRFKVDTSFEASARIDELLASPKVARDLDGTQETYGPPAQRFACSWLAHLRQARGHEFDARRGPRKESLRCRK